MCALRNQNSHKMHDRVPSYYVNNLIYPASYTRNEWQTRTSRRVHDGLSIDRNYGLDTVSDDVNSSPYSSPYYVNGRYHTIESATQRGSSSSVQGIKRMLSLNDEKEDFSEEDFKTTIRLWQGKQIKFKLPYNGKVVGNTIQLKNADGCTGILSIYISASENGKPLYETAVDLCKISMDYFEKVELYSATTVPVTANPRGYIYVRMEIWDEIAQERSVNPFNTGRAIELAATGDGNHKECVYKLGEKNLPVEETYEYSPQPNRPCFGLIYNNWESIPVNRYENDGSGAAFAKDGYRYDLFAMRKGSKARLIIYDREMNTIVKDDIALDSRTTGVNMVQAKNYIYYVDGFSALHRLTIGSWTVYVFPSTTADGVTVTVDVDTFKTGTDVDNSGEYLFSYDGTNWSFNGSTVTLADYGITISGDYSAGGEVIVTYAKGDESVEASASAIYTDARPVIAPSLIAEHNNRIYLSGFLNDPNLVQCTEITGEGPNFDSFLYRFYVPNKSPLATSDNPIVSIVGYTSNTIMFALKKGFSLFSTDSKAATTWESGIPIQVSTFLDGGGVQSAGDICNYKGVVYSFDQDEGIRRFTGALWNKLPAHLDSYIERVDMEKPRKLWGYGGKLYFNYTDAFDGKLKCLIWDQDMNYQQYPWFQDSDIPFCDVRAEDNYELFGAHPDYPCIMKLYAEGVWSRLDSPITFERHTKYISLPGNASDMVLKRVHNKVLANCNRWWYFSICADTDTLEQRRGKDDWYRMPCWDTILDDEPAETPFPDQDMYESNAIARLALPNLRIWAISVQEKIKCKTFREQACLISTVFEAQPRNYN